MNGLLDESEIYCSYYNKNKEGCIGKTLEKHADKAYIDILFKKTGL